MSWKEHHRKSATLAAEAEHALRGGKTENARELYARAAAAELLAVADLDVAKQRTLGISVVSAAALHYKAHDFAQSQAIAYAWLAKTVLPDFAVKQLRTLLETIWTEERQDLLGIEFAPQRVLVSAQGGDVLRGGARLDVIVPTMDRVLKLLRRTADMVSGAEFRTGGPQTPFVKDHFRPWVLQTPPGSYQFAVAMEQQPSERGIPSQASFPSDVVEQALAILSAATEASATTLRGIVPDEHYQRCFLGLVHDLAPSGTSHDRLVWRSTGTSADTDVTLDIGTRRKLARMLRPDRRSPKQDDLPNERRLVGKMHAVDLDQQWLELTDRGTSYRVTGVSASFRDHVVALLDKMVVVNVTRHGSQYQLTQIGPYATRDRQHTR